MMFIRYKRLILMPLLLCWSFAKAQDVLEINEKRVVKQGETLSIKAGTLVKMGPGAVLEVRGSLIIKGTPTDLVKFVNTDSNNPASGIQIVGFEDAASMELNGIVFDGFIQPLRFDPFWYRKNVNISDVRILNSHSFEPVVYVASPFIDLREGRKINFSLVNTKVINNSAGILIESFGSNGINYDIDKIYFADNQLASGDVSLGLLHLEFSETNTNEITSIGKLAFERNDANGNAIGLSVAGSSGHSVAVGGIYGEDPKKIIFDQKRDIRIPNVKVTSTGDLSEYGVQNFIKSISHSYGDLRLVAKGDLSVNKLLDVDGKIVEMVRGISGDTQRFSYIQGSPTFAVLNDGRKVKLPKILLADLPILEVTKIDTAEYNKFTRRVEQTVGGADQSDVLSIGVNIPTFAKKGETVKRLRIWEVGIWGGGGIYGAGDIKPKFTGLPSTIDVSTGLYGQFNLNSRFSLKATGYRTTISIHDLYAFGLFSGTKPLRSYNEQYQEFTTSPNSYRVHFSTNMWIGEVEALWHLRSYQIRDGKRSKLIPTLGLSVGMLHYTPYRYAYTNQKNRETRADYVLRMKEDHRYSLRELGSEGQNFLPNAKPYSSIAFNVGSSFTLTYLFKRFAIKGEMRAAYTSTDYLDDFGSGFWYGGDVDALRANNQIQTITREADLNKIIGYDARIAPNAPRSVDGLNDWYYQLHLGLSYILIK